MHQGKRTALIVLARAGSTRLPGKMLMPFAGGTVLSTVLDRMEHSRLVDETILATTDEPADDPIAELAARRGIAVVRGSVHDVVGRMQQAVRALSSPAHVIVRGCADNPLVMPSVVDAGIEALVSSGADLATPFEHATWPFGFGLVSMTADCLDRIHRYALNPAHREHVENFCFDHPSRFQVHYQQSPPGLEYPELGATLDWAVDLKRLQRFHHMLDGVPIEDQPAALIEAVRATPLWVEGLTRSAPEPGAILLGLAGERSAGTPAPEIVVDVFDWGDERRYGLRYATSIDPIFIDHGDSRQTERPIDFLHRAAIEAEASLKAGPLRPLIPPGAISPVQSKVVHAQARRGFSSPRQERFPERVILQLEQDAPPQQLLERLFLELEQHPDCELVLQADPEVDAGAIQHLAEARLGPERVATLGPQSPQSAFRDLLLTCRGNLMLDPGQATGNLMEISLTQAWCSPKARRLRLRQLNEEVHS